MKTQSLAVCSLLCLLLSQSLHAMEVEESVDAVTGDVSALIKDPGHPGSDLPFSSPYLRGEYRPSSEEGVCKASGYEKAAKGSSRHTSINTLVLQVDASGSLTGGSNAYPIVQIVCVNPTGKQPTEKSVLLNKPVHPNSNLPFSSPGLRTEYGPSSSDGICKALGHLRGVAGAYYHQSQDADTIQVDSSGNVMGGPRTWPLTRIVCASPM